MLKELCETIREKRERVPVFTQFREIAEPLAAFLTTVFQAEGRVLHGGTPVAERQEIEEAFQGRDGLFPTPREISFTRSCPDWALLCKHVAAALYGVGARLDDQPALFFELCGIDMGRFIDVALANKVEAMLANAQKPSDRILEGADLGSLFGVL